MDLNFVSQMLGVIVQSYAGLFAIGVAFFIFLTQLFEDRLNNVSGLLDGNIRSIMDVITHEINTITHEQKNPDDSITLKHKLRDEVTKGTLSFSEWLSSIPNVLPYLKDFVTKMLLRYYKSEIEDIDLLLVQKGKLESIRHDFPFLASVSHIICIVVFLYSLL